MPDSHGPYRNIRFLLELDGIAKAGFTTCRIPESTTDVIRYREGTDPPTVRKLAGLNRYGRLVLETGVTDDSIELYEWYRAVEQGKLDSARRVAAVVLLDREGNPAARWELELAWPAAYRAPRLDATGKDVAIETLEIVCERFERNPGSDDASEEGESRDGKRSDGGDREGDDALDGPKARVGRRTDVDDRPE